MAGRNGKCWGHAERDATKNKIKKLLKSPQQTLDEEFKLLADHTRANVKKESKIGRLEKNKPHNRYVDIGKY